MMPCRKNKCLKQPVCKTKVEIHCNDFLKYVENKYRARSQSPDYNSNQLHRRIWTRLHKTHPKLARVYADEHSDQLNQYSIQNPYTKEWWSDGN